MEYSIRWENKNFDDMGTLNKETIKPFLCNEFFFLSFSIAFWFSLSPHHFFNGRPLKWYYGQIFTP